MENRGRGEVGVEGRGSLLTPLPRRYEAHNCVRPQTIASNKRLGYVCLCAAIGNPRSDLADIVSFEHTEPSSSTINLGISPLEVRCFL